MSDRPLIPLYNVIDPASTSDVQAMEAEWWQWVKSRPDLLRVIDQATRGGRVGPADKHEKDVAPHIVRERILTAKDELAWARLAQALSIFNVVAKVRIAAGLEMEDAWDAIMEAIELPHLAEEALQAAKAYDQIKVDPQYRHALKRLIKALEARDAVAVCFEAMSAPYLTLEARTQYDETRKWHGVKCLMHYDKFATPLHLHDTFMTWWAAAFCDLCEQGQLDAARRMIADDRRPWFVEERAVQGNLFRLQGEALERLSNYIAPVVAASAFTQNGDVPGDLPAGFPGSGFYHGWLGQTRWFTKVSSQQELLQSFAERFQELGTSLKDDTGPGTTIENTKTWVESLGLAFGSTAFDMLERGASPQAMSDLMVSTLGEHPPKTVEQMAARIAWILENHEAFGIETPHSKGSLHLPIHSDLADLLIEHADELGEHPGDRTLSSSPDALALALTDRIGITFHIMDSRPREGRAKFLARTQTPMLWRPNPSASAHDRVGPLGRALNEMVKRQMTVACDHEKSLVVEPTPEYDDAYATTMDLAPVELMSCECCGNPRSGMRLRHAEQDDELNTNRAFTAAVLVWRRAVSMRDLQEKGIDAIIAAHPELIEVHERPRLGLTAPELDSADYDDLLDSFTL